MVSNDKRETFNDVRVRKSLDAGGAVVTGIDGSGGAPIVAPVGGLQNAIDSAAADGGGHVALESGKIYDPGVPIVVKQDVTLDCTGAFISITSDHDVFHWYPGSNGINPAIVAETGFVFSSVVHHLDSSWAGTYSPQSQTCVSIRGGYTNIGRAEGTIVKFETVSEAIAGQAAAMWGNVVQNHDTDGGDTVYELYSGPANDGNWINTNDLHGGSHAGFRLGMKMHGDREMVGNHFGGKWQPGGPTDSFLDWDSTHTTGAAETTFYGALWDAFGCSASPLIFGTGCRNTTVESTVPFRDAFPDSYPYTDNGPGNIVVDTHQRRKVFSQFALNPDGTAPP